MKDKVKLKPVKDLRNCSSTGAQGDMITKCNVVSQMGFWKRNT